MLHQSKVVGTKVQRDWTQNSNCSTNSTVANMWDSFQFYLLKTDFCVFFLVKCSMIRRLSMLLKGRFTPQGVCSLTRGKDPVYPWLTFLLYFRNTCWEISWAISSHYIIFKFADLPVTPAALSAQLFWNLSLIGDGVWKVPRWLHHLFLHFSMRNEYHFDLRWKKRHQTLCAG